MTELQRPRRTAWIWWAAYLLVILYLALPGPDRTPFSGLPLATKTQLVFFALLGLGLFCRLFPPRRNPRMMCVAALVVLAGLKLALASFLVESGWKGEYAFISNFTLSEKTLTPMRFYQAQRIRDYRVDRAITFQGANFALHFVNDLPAGAFDAISLPRDVQFPLKVRWTGYVAPQRPLVLAVSAAGSVSIDVDGQRIFTGRDPAGVRVDVPQTAAAGMHQLVITYEKPAEVRPAITIGGVDTPVVPARQNYARLAASERARAGIMIAGLLALLVLAVAFYESYRPLSELLLVHLWEQPSRIAVLLFVAFFLLLGFSHGVPQRSTTIEMNPGDDFLIYEGLSRQVLHDGLLMVYRSGEGDAYYFYPLYPYALAGAHALLGEDFGTIVTFNYVCLATLGILGWLILRRRVGETQLVIILLLLFWLTAVHLRGYVHLSFSDNLFAPLVFAALAACIAGLERQRGAYLLLAGVLTSLAAATRPSFMVFAPFFAMALLVAQRRTVGFGRRVWDVVQYLFGVGAGVSPFTFRNWLVTGRFVLLVTAYSTIADFLFAPEETRSIPGIHGPPSALNTLRVVLAIVSPDPLHFAWVAVRKFLFVLGFPGVGPANTPTPSYFFILTILFLAALWLRRIPWAVGVTLVTFALSHIAAVILGAPWTYGYKTILPLHCVFVLGIAFLLPRRRETADAAPASTPQPVRGVSPVTVIVPESLATNEQVALLQSSPEVAGVVVTGEGAAAIRDAIRGAAADCIVVLGPGASPRSVRQLLAYRDDHDVVVGTPPAGRGTPFPLRVERWVPGSVLRVMYGTEPLLDVGAALILIRQESAPKLLDRLTGDDEVPGADLLLAAARAGLAITQIPIATAGRSTASPEVVSRRVARALRLSAVAQLADLRAARRQSRVAAAESPRSRRNSS